MKKYHVEKYIIKHDDFVGGLIHCTFKLISFLQCKWFTRIQYVKRDQIICRGWYWFLYILVMNTNDS